MLNRPRRLTLAVTAIACMLGFAAPAPSEAAIEPPWCGTPETDLVQTLDSQPGSFPHIPYYAIGCTLEDIRARSHGRMSVEVVGRSALGRPMYGVVINAMDTAERRQAFQNWQQIRNVALTDPARGQALAAAAGDRVKVPVFVQGGIHGNESEGVDAIMQIIERLATTANGQDDEVDAILDDLVLVFNVVQNPDGRVAQTRANGNGFDLNRDYMTQSQPETIASIDLMKKWLPPEVLDLHGYVNPTLVEATTKPHNPSVEYDMWLKWNQDRIDANEAALAAENYDITRPINDWCPEGDAPNPETGLCDDGLPGGPDRAEGWDDWGPFYTAMYAQHVGLDSSTVEMCRQSCGGGQSGRASSRRVQYIVTWSTFEYVEERGTEMLHDELENYRRGVTDAPRPDCCPPPFESDDHHNWMRDYPQAYVIPVGAGQRSNAEAGRLVDWLLYNDIQVEQLKEDYGGFQAGSYVVWISQARRGLIDTALSAGVDISLRINRLYAPPAAWSHGFLWGADVVEIPDGAQFAPPEINRILRPSAPVGGGVEPGTADRYALVIDSPTAVRTLNSLVREGASAQLATAPFTSASGAALPAGTVIFGADADTRNLLSAVGREAGLRFRRVRESAVPATEAIEGVPKIAVLIAESAFPPTTQEVWVLRELGFTADPYKVSALNGASTDPLSNYDIVFSAVGWPSAANPTARTRLTQFFATGGGYIGALSAGAGFLVTGGQVTGLTAVNRGGNGRSGIVNWVNVGGAASPLTGAYPANDTAIMDPPTWFTAVSASLTVDARLPASNLLLAGLWDWAGELESASAPNAPIAAHGTNTSGSSRVAVFAMNPLYRADPEREWPMTASAAYWIDR